MRPMTGRSRWLLLALLGGTLITGLALVAPSPGDGPDDKTAQGVPDTQKVAGAEGDRFAPKLSESEQLLEAGLAKPVTCKYRDTPLSDVVADLAKQVELPIELDAQGLEEAGVDQGAPITFEAGPLSLRAVFTLLEVRHKLGYMSRLGGLRLTSAETAAEEQNQVVRVYPISDLVKDFVDPAPAYGDYESLIDLMSNHVDGDSWNDNGGTGAISGFFGSLVVRQTLARHHRVACILAGLRKFPLESATAVKTAAGPTHAALAKPLTGEAKGDLDDFFTQAGESLKIPIVVDTEGLKNIDVETTAPVRGEFREQSGYQVLSGMLRPLHLSTVVFPEFVLVTREGNEPPAQDTRLYSVAGLVDVDRLQRTGHPFGSVDSLDTVIDVITSSVEPQQWSDNGGPGQIIGLYSPVCLAVTATYDIHLQIEPLLDSLRLTRKEELAKARRSEERIVERVYTLYLPRRQLKAELARPKTDPPPAAPAATPPASVPAAPAAAPPGARPAKPASDEDPFGSNRRKQSQALVQFGGMGMGGMSGMGGYARPYGFAQVTDPIPTADDVAGLVRELLPDPSWKEEGVLLKPFHDVLIVRQRGPMLRKVEKLLHDIDAWHPPAQGGFGGSMIPVVGDRR